MAAAPLDRFDETPLPHVSDIPSLVDRYRDAGLQVEVFCDLGDVAAGAMTSLTAFRLAHEAMTNALQHVPGALLSLRIHLDQDRSTICLTAEDPLRDPVPQGRNDSR